ncbi:MAG: hypothetical protein JSW60_02615, partial [Thermoplasmatales archaeon]
MQKPLLKKGITFAAIVFFIGLAIAPSINASVCRSSENKISKPPNITVVDESNSEPLGDTIFRKSILLTTPEIQKVGDNFKIHIEEETSKTMKPNNPLLPVVTHVFVFPFRAKIKDVSVCFYGLKEKKISGPICLATEPLPLIYTKIDMITSPFENGEKSSVLYPEKHFNYNVGAGRYDDRIMNYLSVSLYPIQYDSLDNTVYYWSRANISICYELPEKPIVLGDEYD